MVYDYLVKHNGKYYNPGEEVPDNVGPLSSEEPKVSDVNPELPFSDTEVTFEAGTVSEPASIPSRRGRPRKPE